MNGIDLEFYKKEITAYYRGLESPDIEAEFIEKGLLIENKKTKKGDNVDIILELVPSNLIQGFNNCINAENCLPTCLFWGGVNNLFKVNKLELSTAIMIRVRRFFLLKSNRKLFNELLELDIARYRLKAIFKRVKLGVRLNGLSDLNFKAVQRDVRSRYPDVNFYDYTKNYKAKHVADTTYSYDGTDRIPFFELLARGKNVAVVFEVSKKNPLPKEWYGFKVINGDLSDARYDDEKGVVVGLSVKPTMKGKHSRKGGFITV